MGCWLLLISGDGLENEEGERARREKVEIQVAKSTLNGNGMLRTCSTGILHRAIQRSMEESL